MEASFLHYWSCLCVELKCFRDAVFSPLEVIPMERGQKIAHELGMISFILGYVVSNCCVQQKGRTCDAKYDSIETFHENVWMFVIRIIYPKKAQNILASFFDRTIRKAFTMSAAKATRWYLKRISTSGMSARRQEGSRSTPDQQTWRMHHRLSSL